MTQITETPSSQVRSLDVILLAVGFGCLLGFSRLFSLDYDSSSIAAYATRGVLAYQVRSVLRLLTILALMVLGMLGRLSVGRICVACSTILMAGSAVALSQIGVSAVAADPLQIALAAVAGVSNGVLLYAWARELCTLELREIVAVSVISLVVGGVIIMFSLVLEGTPFVALMAITGVLGGWLILFYDEDLSACVADGMPTPHQLRTFSWLPLLATIICCCLATLTYGIVTQFYWVGGYPISYPMFGIAACLVITAVVCIIVGSRSWMNIVWVPAFILLLISLIVATIPLARLVQYSMGLLLASVFCHHLLVWLICCAIISRSDIPRAFACGLFLVASNASIGAQLGTAIAAALPAEMQSLTIVSSIISILLVAFLAIALVVSYALPRRDAQQLEAAAPSDETAPAPATGAPVTEASPPAAAPKTFEQRFDELSQQYGLTDREREIAELTARGYSSTRIAERLYISSSTVRFHQQNVYRKFDIHSRQEFVDLVNGADSPLIA